MEKCRAKCSNAVSKWQHEQSVRGCQPVGMEEVAVDFVLQSLHSLELGPVLQERWRQHVPFPRGGVGESPEIPGGSTRKVVVLKLVRMAGDRRLPCAWIWGCHGRSGQ